MTVEARGAKTVPDKPKKPVGRRRRISRAFAEMHYQLRTEGDTPVRTALSVWLGTALGCLPVYGLHLALCAGLARLLRVSRIKCYLAAHVNNPLTAPFLIYGGYGIGHWIYTGSWPVMDESLRELHLWDLGRDLFVGSLILGVVLGALFALLSLFISIRWRGSTLTLQLKEQTSRRYMECGIFDWEFVRGKLRHDPLYYQLLKSGILPDDGRLIDLGCGRGIVLALLATARTMAERGEWGSDWPAPPSALDLIGVELRARAAETASQALGDEARIEVADLSMFQLPACRALLLLDVLHYLPERDQDLIVARAAQALEPGGVLILRDADASAGSRFFATYVAERLCAIARGHWRQRFHYRSAESWHAMLTAQGLVPEQRAMWRGTPYSNVLITARLPG